MLYEVSTLYFKTDTADGFREPGFFKERRLQPQITQNGLSRETVKALLASNGNELISFAR